MWKERLKTRQLGRPEAICAFEMPSTNTRLKEAALGGAPAGTVCLCQTQTAGKGRLGRSWFSPPHRGLWVSVLLRPAMEKTAWPHLTLAAALAVCRAVEKQGLEPRIKWPNDLVLEGRKVCGILLESGPDFVVVGTGLNLRPGSYPPDLAGRAVSLEEIAGRAMDADQILADYLNCLEAACDALAAHGLEGIKADYESRSCTLGRQVRVTGGLEAEGLALSLDADGALILQTPEGTLLRVLAGDVSVRGIMGYAE